MGANVVFVVEDAADAISRDTGRADRSHRWRRFPWRELPASPEMFRGGGGRRRPIPGVMGANSLGLAGVITETRIFGSARTALSVRSTSSGLSMGRRRQFMTAVAVCGSAFSAWPPESMVATQAVRAERCRGGWRRAVRPRPRHWVGDDGLQIVGGLSGETGRCVRKRRA